MICSQNALLRHSISLLALLFVVGGTASAQYTSKYFDSNGVQIHFIDIGEGEPVVLMHGLNSNLQRAWFDRDIAKQLQGAGFRVLAIDARAHGKSGTPHDPAQYGPEMALDLKRMLDHVGLSKAHVVGYSMGALIAGKLRELHPDRIASLTLGGYGWRRETGPSPYHLELAASLERGDGLMPLYRYSYPDWSEEDREARSRATLDRLPDIAATVALLRGYNFSVAEKSLRNNTVPTLAIIGELDPRKESVDAFQGVMKNLEIVVIEGAEHGEVPGRPEFITRIIEFINQQSVD
jgi:pimeloyl-ACP methyl ester carboxylesterase